jgi:hypothetical protein
MQDAMTQISEQEFLAIATAENCHAILDERMQAISPIYSVYSSSAQDFMKSRVFPPWRTTLEANQYVGNYRVSRKEAFPISYFNLSKQRQLFQSINFDPDKDYFRTNRVIAFHCRSCGVRLVKDGNHRLLQCALKRLDPELQIYEVSSENWSAAEIDMKNFCECISNNALKATCEDARA